MSGMGGLEAARLIRQELPSVQITIMSLYDPVEFMPRAVLVGVNACVDKGRLGADLVLSIRAAQSASESH